MRIMLVTASDSRFMPFLRGMLSSIQSWLDRPDVRLACFDIGLNAADREFLAGRSIEVVQPRPHLGVDPAGRPAPLLSFLARPFLPEYFPGNDVYVWIDSDVWLQDPSVLQTYIDGALQTGMAITHERTASYRFQPRLRGWTTKHFILGYGVAEAAFLLTRRHVNAGFFAIAAGAPQWGAWAECYARAIARTGALVPHDQFALNQALHGEWRKRATAPVTLLPPECNWICDRGIPMWDDTAGRFCDPRAPFTAIRALHLAGPAKRATYTIRRSGGGSFATCLVYGAGPNSPRPSPVAGQSTQPDRPPEPDAAEAAAASSQTGVNTGVLAA
jgi:hypothetical protein